MLIDYVRVKGGESEWFRIDSRMTQGYIMSPWLVNVFMDALMKDAKMGMERRGENGDYLVSCMQMAWFCMVSWRRI